MKSHWIRRAIAWLTLFALCWSAIAPATADGLARGASADPFHDICFGDPAKARASDAQQADGDRNAGKTASAAGHCDWCFLQLGHGAASAPASLSFAQPRLRQASFQPHLGPIRVVQDWHLAPSRAPPTLG